MLRWQDVSAWRARLDPEGETLLRRTLDRVADTPPDMDLDHLHCEEALAAAEVVASCAGAAPDTLPADVRDYVEGCGVPSDDLLLAAFRAVERVGMQRAEHDDALVDLEERLGALLAG